MQAVEVVLQHLPNMTSISVGRFFFNNLDRREKDLGFGVQVWNGTFLSIRPTQWKMMMLNVDTCSTVFYKPQPVLNFVREYFKLPEAPRYLDRVQMEDFNDEIKGLKIETTHINREFQAYQARQQRMRYSIVMVKKYLCLSISKRNITLHFSIQIFLV
jgi:eukaryotic translation initiation factor 2C